jgi:hypothetical protein
MMLTREHTNIGRAMKIGIVFFIILLLFAACVSKSAEQEKAEKLVKQYVQNLCHNSTDCKISYKPLRAVYTSVEDEPEYKKFEANSRKLDSLKRKFSPKIRGWTISVKFYGKNEFCVKGNHMYIIDIDKEISKVVVGVELE